MKIEVFQRKRLLLPPLYYFRIRADNGKVVAQSEGYSRRIDCVGTVHSVRNGIPRAEIIDA